MPERPKRRKNKNKRKNKNNRPDTNKNSSEKDSGESCSTAVDEGETLPEGLENTETPVVGNHSSENVTVENGNCQEIICGDGPCVNEDFNNNSDTRSVETLQVPAPDLNIVDSENITKQESASYIVESPDQSLKNKPKLNNKIKSKSLDNDEDPKIVDVTEDITSQSEEDSTFAVIDTSNVIVSDVESDIEWEKTDELKGAECPPLNDVGTLSITTIPLSVAQCQQTKSLSPDVETSLRNYLRTLNLSTHPENADSVEIKAEIEQIINREIRHRLRKKGFADDIVLQRLGPPRTLDVIDEEGSSESSMTSRRQSYLSDKKSDNEDLEDDVFEDKNKTLEKIAKRTETIFHHKTFGRLVPQQCVLVGAKLKDPEVTEARGDWTVRTMEKMTGAEVVYLTDSSSSTSSLHDYGDETDDGMDTDVSIRMITPTIEVTDTEDLLKKTYIANDHVTHKYDKSGSKDIVEHIIKIDCKKDDVPEKRSNVESNSHEIVVLSTDNIKTNLYVKEVEPSLVNQSDINRTNKTEEDLSSINCDDIKTKNDKYDLEIKVLKCELNDAINNLIKEVSDSEINENSNEKFIRQDSSSSVCSSQCTAKYNPTSSSLNDVSNILHDEVPDNNITNTENKETTSASSHVKDVFEHVAGATAETKKLNETYKEPLHLRDICVRRIATFPYGDKILEELASVSKRLQNITGAFTTENTSIDTSNKKVEQSTKNNMPYYPLPDLSPIDKVILPTNAKEPVPPPVQPRNSSLKKKSREEEIWTGVPTKTEPVYVCLSPSQKMLMEKTNTVITKEDASELADLHKKYVDRRGYNEQYTKENCKDVSGTDVSPIVPFKSQTGSRLLALIRDPTVTSNVSSFNKHLSSELFEKKSSMQQTLLTQNHNKVENLSNTFRPIPPPRPRRMTSSFYESDESSDFTDSSLRSMKSEKKMFHFSTGNLNKEIENDISSIQNMHRYYTNTRDTISDCPRRPSLPKDLCDQQMEYIRQKEKEVEAEIQRLESLRDNVQPSSPQKLGPRAPLISEKELAHKSGPRAPLISEKEVVDEKIKDANNFFISKRKDVFACASATENNSNLDAFRHFNDKKEKSKLSSLFSSSQEELLREKMYSEYVTQMAQREERKQQKVIKITNTPTAPSNKIWKSMPIIDSLDSKVNNRIEKEFICKARERWDKLGIKDPETEDERESGNNNVYREHKVIEHKIKVIEGGREKDVKNLPNHLQEFVRFTAKDKEQRTDVSGESKSGPASPHVMIWCAVIIIVLAVGKYFIRLIRNK